MLVSYVLTHCHLKSLLESSCYSNFSLCPETSEEQVAIAREPASSPGFSGPRMVFLQANKALRRSGTSYSLGRSAHAPSLLLKDHAPLQAHWEVGLGLHEKATLQNLGGLLQTVWRILSQINVLFFFKKVT